MARVSKIDVKTRKSTSFIFFYLYICVQIHKFKVNGPISNFPKDPHVDPKVYILEIFVYWIRVPQASNPQVVILGHFYIFVKILCSVIKKTSLPEFV